MIDRELLDFLRELAQNNNKEWFNPRKQQYKRLRAAFPGGLDQGNKLKTAPRGTSRDHPAIDLLRLTSFTATRGFSDEHITSEDFHGELMALYKALYPLNAYLDKALRRIE